MNPLFEQRQPNNPVLMTPEQLEQLRMLVAAQTPHSSLTALGVADPQEPVKDMPAWLHRLIGIEKRLEGNKPEPSSFFQHIGIRG